MERQTTFKTLSRIIAGVAITAGLSGCGKRIDIGDQVNVAQGPVHTSLTGHSHDVACRPDKTDVFTVTATGSFFHGADVTSRVFRIESPDCSGQVHADQVRPAQETE